MAYERRTVKMCVCHRKKFEVILELAKEHNCRTIEEIKEADIACNGCGMCHPYVQKMLITGETRFVPGDVYVNSEN